MPSMDPCDDVFGDDGVEENTLGEYTCKPDNVATISSHHLLFFSSRLPFLPVILWLLSKRIWFDHWIHIVFKFKMTHLLLWIHSNLITKKQDVQLLKVSILSHKSQWTLLQEKQSIMFGIRRRILYYPISLEERSQQCFSVLEIALYTNWKGLEVV